MTHAKSVELAFATFRETGYATVHTQLSHAFAPTGQHLVGIGLVADVPDQTVFRRIEDIVQRDGQFDRAEI